MTPPWSDLETLRARLIVEKTEAAAADRQIKEAVRNIEDIQRDAKRRIDGLHLFIAASQDARRRHNVNIDNLQSRIAAAERLERSRAAQRQVFGRTV